MLGSIWLDDLLYQLCGETSIISKPLGEKWWLEVRVEWQALFVCIKLHAAIYAALVTECIIHQYLEAVVQDKWLLKLKLEDFAAFFQQDLSQPYVEVYIMQM